MNLESVALEKLMEKCHELCVSCREYYSVHELWDACFVIPWTALSGDDRKAFGKKFAAAVRRQYMSADRGQRVIRAYGYDAQTKMLYHVLVKGR